MKFISLIVFFLALHWSWGLVNNPRSLNQEVHLGIQEDLKELISQYIQKSLPTSHSLRFDRFWTEKVKNNQVKASFVYSFEDEDSQVGEARVGIEGYAILNLTNDPDSEEQIWSFDELYILNNQVEFKDALEIHPSGGGEEAAPSETTEE